MYNGAWDTNGFAIAYGALKRWPSAVRLGRMDPTVSEDAPLSADQAPWRDAAETSVIAPAAWALVRTRPRYQESWIPALIGDLRLAFTRNPTRAG